MVMGDGGDGLRGGCCEGKYWSKEKKKNKKEKSSYTGENV